jgi:hypothetical protein
VLGWLRERSDRPLGRLALQWFRAYFAASRNSGCAISMYSSLSVLPAALVFVAAFYAPGGSVNVFAEHLVNHLNLTGETAKLVEDTFGSASSNALAASVATAGSFLLWGIGIGQLYQDVYARAWDVKVGSAADQWLYAIFFFVFAGALTLVLVAQSELGDTGRWAVLVPAWLFGSLVFWLGAPHFLLHRKVALRTLLPGALLATLVPGGHGGHLAALSLSNSYGERQGLRFLRHRPHRDRLPLRDDHPVARLGSLLSGLVQVARGREEPWRALLERGSRRPLNE